MEDIERSIAKASEDRNIPGAVLLARDKSGKLNYSKALGLRTLEPGHEEPMELTSVFDLKSMSKLITSVAILQGVERGHLSLDEELDGLLPELASQPVLHGFESDDKTPILKPRTKPLTLRHLMTHSSGLAYSFMNPSLAKYLESVGRPVGLGGTGTVEELFTNPLVFEPGEGFVYGSGLDWAGRALEKATGQDLETYVTENIFAPLGITGITFYPGRRPDFASRLVALSVRDAKTGKVTHSPAPPPEPAKAALGGQGLYADLNDYFKVMWSLLVDDEKLLKKETAARMFQPQLVGKAREACLAEFKNPFWAVGHIPDTGEYNWGLAGLLVDGDSHENRRRGTMLWSGVFNLTWFIDRETGVAGIYASQLLPNADPEVEKFIKAFEDAIYAQVK